MGTRYIIRAESGDEVAGTLTRHTRKGAFEAADTLLDAHGENTKVTITWEMIGDRDNIPRGLFE